MISGYSSPLNLGHKALEEFWDGKDIIVQEKIDGSQFSFGLDIDGQPTARSHKQALYVAPPFEGMFAPALTYVHALATAGRLRPGWTYRGEFLSKPKHNHLAYNRIPLHGIILFDVDKADQWYVDPEELSLIAHVDLELECVPHIATLTEYPGVEKLIELMTRESFLGGPMMEGIVLKNYRLFGSDHKALMGKLVSADFKETQGADWKKQNPSRSDALVQIIENYRTPARWRKAVQHLREEGRLLGAPQDIPALLKEINEDVLKDCQDEIKDALFKYYWKDISRGITRGMPEWYKHELATTTEEEEHFGEAEASA